jgi:hypothetical protein
MKIHLHIGLEGCGILRLQDVLSEKRAQLEGKGVLFPRAPGPRNHTRLFMSATAPYRPDPLRVARGFADPDHQARLRNQVVEALKKDVERARPDVLILSASQLATGLTDEAELQCLRDMLVPLSTDITVTMHLDDPARLLAWNYAAQVFEGRVRGLDLEIGLLKKKDWWRTAIDMMPTARPDQGIFPVVQGPAFWLDYQALVAFWEGVFGAGSVRLRRYDAAKWAAPDVTDELREAFDIPQQIGKAAPWQPPLPPSAEWLARARELNGLLVRLLAKEEHVVPRPLWRKFIEEIRIGGQPITPESLAFVAARFTPGLAALSKKHPGLDLTPTELPPGRHGWGEPAPHNGFRASQYLLGWFWRIERATAEAAKGGGTDATQKDAAVARLSDKARSVMSPLAIEKFVQLQGSPFKPHNRLGRVNEEELAAPYHPAPPRDPGPGSSGRVIVGCMKNEAPYIVEWIAHHRAIGFDTFLIYTNGCTDGTDAILKRLDAMGVVHHRDNDDWSGQSPQQFALDAALEEDVIKRAEWIAHIDVDEFVNVRCGNGTLDDFFAATPGATNVAMTWRLFGHGGVKKLADRPVIEQFTACAPKFCPKPHTAWGFKTMFRNIGAYGKLSCHRPNKLDDDKAGQVMWVNGNGAVTTREMLKNGWRSSQKSIGYDLLQLNHYALRSAESYLIKRQRGRALHVDRSIGLNYWIRMDWCDYTDVTIQRNLPRVQAEMARLFEDDALRELHEAGFAWHQAKAAELHAEPEFQDLYQQALTIELNETERVAYALAQDLES